MSELSKIKRRILVIDDNPSIHEDYRKVLCGIDNGDSALDRLSAELFGEEVHAETPVPSYEIDSAYQGCDALAMLEAALQRGEKYAMAFVDMRMPPGWDGIETIEHLWQVDPELNVVICTAYSDYSWRDVVSRLGTNDRWMVLKKPFDSVEICQFAAALAEKQRLSVELRREMEVLEEKVDQRTKEVRDREGRLRAILDTAPDGIVVLDQEGRIQSLNHTAEELFGKSQQEAIGLHISTVVESEEGAGQDPVTQLLRNAERVLCHSLHASVRRSDGTVFPALWTIGEFRDSANRCFTAVVRDETERELMQRELNHAQKMESIGQLAAGIAHEINTPMQFVNDNTHFLKECLENFFKIIDYFDCSLETGNQGIPWEERHQNARKLMESCHYERLQKEVPGAITESIEGIERVVQIVRAMKEFSHPGGVQKVATDLNQAISSAATISKNRWKYSADLELALDPSLPRAEVLPSEINQVLLNLLVNASDAIAEKYDATGERGVISISTRHEHDHVLVEIADNGSGIPPEIQDRVFDPFFTTKEVGKGTGQGLAICHNIVVNKHNGHIDFESKPRAGTTFTIRLPLGNDPENLSDCAARLVSGSETRPILQPEEATCI